MTEKYDGDCPDPRTSEEIECDVEECPGNVYTTYLEKLFDCINIIKIGPWI